MEDKIGRDVDLLQRKRQEEHLMWEIGRQALMYRIESRSRGTSEIKP